MKLNDKKEEFRIYLQQVKSFVSEKELNLLWNWILEFSEMRQLIQSNRDLRTYMATLVDITSKRVIHLNSTTPTNETKIKGEK